MRGAQFGIGLATKYGVSGYYAENGGWSTALMVAGELAGTTPFAEGIYGVDMGWGYSLGSFESGARTSSGALTMAGWVAGGYAAARGSSRPAAAPTPQYYIQEGVRRSVAAREAGLTQVPATIFREGQAPVTTQVPLNQLFSPKPEIPLDSRFLGIQPPIRVPIILEQLGLPGQLPTVPISEVTIVPPGGG
jgi:hypothetical protein